MERAAGRKVDLRKGYGHVSRVDGLLEAGLLILEDACPPDPTAYLCRCSDYDGECCGDCWRAYLFAVANGRKNGTCGASSAAYAALS